MTELNLSRMSNSLNNNGAAAEQSSVGGHISTLLQHNTTMTTLILRSVTLHVHGARQIKVGLAANRTVTTLKIIDGSLLGTDGVSLIVDALLESNTVRHLELEGTAMGSTGVRHLARLLQRQQRQDNNNEDSSSSCLEIVSFARNNRLCRNEEATRLFTGALATCPTVKELNVDYCNLPNNAIVLLFQALAVNQVLETFHMGYNNGERLQGSALVAFLDALPRMSLTNLYLYCDIRSPVFLAALHKNLSLCHFYRGFDRSDEITTGPVHTVMLRNRKYRMVRKLLRAEVRQTNTTTTTTTRTNTTNNNVTTMIPLFKKLWGWTMIDCAKSNEMAGATAIYFALREKLPMWWSPTTNTTAAAAAAAASTTTDTTASTS